MLPLLFAVLLPIAQKEQPNAKADQQGDPLPAGAVARIGTTRFRHGNWLQSVAFSKDGKRLSSASYWHEDAVWNAESGQSIAFRCDRDTTPWHSVLSPDGSLVAGHVEEIGLCVQEPGTGKEHWRFPGKKNAVQALAFSHDNRWLASADDDGNAFLWDLKAGKKAHEWKSPEKNRYGQLHIFSPDGKTLVHATEGGNLVAWDIPSGKELYHLKPKKADFGLSHTIRGMSVSPNNEFLATRAFMGPVTLRSLKTGKFEREIGNGLGSGPTFSPDGKMIAAGDYRQAMVHCWNPADGKLLRSYEVKTMTSIHCLAFSPDGKRMAAGADRAVHMWNTETGKELFPIESHPVADVSAQILNDDKTLVLRYQYENLTSHLELDSQIDFGDLSGRMQKRMKFDFNMGKDSFLSPLHMAVAPDGKSLAFATGVSFLRYHRPIPNGFLRSDLRLCEVATSKELKAWNKRGCEVRALSFSPNGHFFAASVNKAGTNEDGYGRESVIELWHRDSPTSMKKTIEIANRSTIRWAPDSGWLAIGAKKGWDFADSKTGKLLRHCADLNQNIGAVCPSGRRLVCWSFDKQTAELAEQASGKTICKLDCGGIYIIWASFAVSPDGRIVAGDLTSENIYLWDTFTGKKIGTLKGHRGSIKSLCFTADGRFLISGSTDTTALVWDYRKMIEDKDGNPAKLSEKRLQEIWRELQSVNAEVGYKAVRDLMHSPDQAISLLRQKMAPVNDADHARMQAWIDKLDNPDFQERDRAQSQLNEVRELAEPLLRKTLTRNLPLEAKRRMEGQLELVINTATPKWLANLRSLESLELIGSPDARKVIEEIAGGHADSPLTREAQRTLDRMRR